MNTNTLIILGLATVAGYLLFFRKDMSAGEASHQTADPINPKTTAEKADDMGLVDMANPAPGAIVSNNPYGDSPKGVEPRIAPWLKVPTKKGLAVTPQGLIPPASNADFNKLWGGAPTKSVVGGPGVKSVVGVPTTKQPTFAPTSRSWK